MVASRPPIANLKARSIESKVAGSSPASTSTCTTFFAIFFCRFSFYLLSLLSFLIKFLSPLHKNMGSRLWRRNRVPLRKLQNLCIISVLIQKSPMVPDSLQHPTLLLLVLHEDRNDVFSGISPSALRSRTAKGFTPLLLK